MSAAHKLVTNAQIHYGGTVAAPAPRSVVRPAPRRRVKLGPALTVGSAWLLFMFLCFALVQKTATFRKETADIAHMKAEIAQLELRSLELEGQIASQTSLAEVEKWARAHNMTPPTGIVQTLPGKQEAVAARRNPAPAPTQVAAQPEPTSFWQALLARFTGASQAAGAKR